MQSGHLADFPFSAGTDTVSASLLAGIVAALTDSDINPHVCLDAAGIEHNLCDNPAGRLPLSAFLEFLNQLLLQPQADENLGVQLGCQLAVSSFNALGYAAANSDCLNDALALIPKYEALVMTCGRTRIQAQQDEVTVSWAMSAQADQWPQPQLMNLLENLFLASWVTLARMLTGNNHVLNAVCFTHRQPGNIALWHTVFGADVRFNQTQAMVRFPRALLSLTINQSDPFIHQVMLREAQSLSATLQQKTLAAKVMEWLMIALPEGEPDQQAVAEFFNISERTLRRRLQQEDTSYQKILETTRQQRANYYLQQTDLPLAEVADRLGYQHLSAFNAAYKRWTGNTPGSARKAKAL